ncbi:ankyrin repeat domain-containing protein [Paenibacillus sp. 19GGS1-52]|uniref:ankyrin repeat domain-containing protein n=1 Tax=Paenibacillus sp. 19GGS1-52 TaxID=2758563 RepID=UPI001EFB071A|nr:ankyrin repeat domain-containing protein [Paenibacillus sp. 19GGS1-52]ULO07116.1 ankyrin repeat domain-containing protein [Paenibacillus sp. 19GGS1-52]
MSKIFDAVLTENIQLLQQQLESGENINIVDEDGRTALIHAVIDNLTEITKFLIERGANVDAQDNLGYTPLHYASQNYLPEVVKQLLDNKANVDVKDSHGNTPLFRAVFNSRGRGEVILLLLSFGADAHKKNNHDLSPIELAKTISNYDVTQYFR